MAQIGIAHRSGAGIAQLAAALAARLVRANLAGRPNPSGTHSGHRFSRAPVVQRVLPLLDEAGIRVKPSGCANRAVSGFSAAGHTAWNSLPSSWKGSAPIEAEEGRQLLLDSCARDQSAGSIILTPGQADAAGRLSYADNAVLKRAQTSSGSSKPTERRIR
jgi:hypothetical protein